ncbi:MAG: hypothetical protein AAF677_04260 [Pseudomonadota bacterium]
MSRPAMLFAAAVAAGAGLSPASAAACPDASTWGLLRFQATGAQLFDPRYAEVSAGGGGWLGDCRTRVANARGTLSGYFPRRPAVSLRLTGLDDYELEFRTDSPCDTLLLINSGSGIWYYNDDATAEGDAAVRIVNPTDGIWDIWIGTFRSERCDASLVVDTF